MTADSIAETQVRDPASEGREQEYAVPGSRLGGISESPVVRGIIDVTMVGLLGGGPRLAIRAARVMLQDNYEPRPSVPREPRRRNPWQRRPN